MKTKTLKKNKVNVITLGCAKNVFDSEILMGQLKANRFEVEHEGRSNDYSIIIINTCGFIEEAKQESIDTILTYAEAKEKKLIDKLLVTGCLSERYKDELTQEIPQVDAFFGTRDLPKLLKTLNADYKKELVGERLLTTPTHYAYLKIAEGCDRPCAFCAIPLMRGKHQSTPIENLVKQAEKLARNGTRELILIAQDLTYYGLDLYKKRKLAELIRKLSEIEQIEWIRLHYAYPSGFPMEVIDEMKNNPKICNYLDIPLQHISNNMLKKMRRGITKEKTLRLIDDIRTKIPDITLRTTLISGFPGETEADFEELYQFVEETRFDRLGIFPYSHEENTFAYQYTDDVPADIKMERANSIMELQGEISLQKNQNKIGSTQKVIIDRFENNFFIGRTEADSPDVDNEVLIPYEQNLNLKKGAFYTVEITDAEIYDLIGKVKQPI